MSALPRPVTPGPWQFNGFTGQYQDEGHPDRGGLNIRPTSNLGLGLAWGDGWAAAALPEWIAERDRFRAALVEADRLLALWAGSRPDDETEHLRANIRAAIQGTEP